mgnify:CR=1 FL=1|tara:strand:+ start:717 stop:896 length:180 start_codon:yes stop_codon:yes gene_type:complete
MKQINEYPVHIQEIQKLLDDLGWEYDRMSSSGQETLEELWKIFGMKTFEKDSWEGENNG